LQFNAFAALLRFFFENFQPPDGRHDQRVR
jgi:hypothetical protein